MFFDPYEQWARERAEASITHNRYMARIAREEEAAERKQQAKAAPKRAPSKRAEAVAPSTPTPAPMTTAPSTAGDFPGVTRRDLPAPDGEKRVVLRGAGRTTEITGPEDIVEEHAARLMRKMSGMALRSATAEVERHEGGYCEFKGRG